MKRKLALLLALVMVLSVVPMMSFAASGNTKTIIKGGVPKVADDYKSDVASPQNHLIIQEDNYSVSAGENFQLKIENAKWLKDSNKDYPAVVNTVYYEIEARTDRVLDIKLNTAIEKDVYEFDIPLLFEVDGAGPVKVTVDGMDSDITGGTYTIANATKGATITTVDDVVTFSEKVTLETIRIEETSAGALDGKQKVKLRLPSNFEWAGNPSNLEFIGGLDSGSNVTVINEPNHDNGRDLEFEINVTAPSNKRRGVILLKGLEIYATSNAKEGDVEVRISGGDVSSETITVAKYSDFDVTVKADGDPKELISGRFEASDEDGAYDSGKRSDIRDDAHKLQTLIIEEEVEDALLNRRTKVEFPSWVKILAVDVTTTDANVDFHGVKSADSVTNVSGTNQSIILSDGERNDSDIEFTIKPAVNREAKVEFKFYVSVKANAEGDIVAEVSGRSGAEGKATLGKARRPVELEIKGETPKLELGKKGQPIPEIYVSEIKAEDIMDESDLVLNLSNEAEWNDYQVEVIEGDLEIDHDNVDTDAGNLIIPIKPGDSSTKPSTIKVSKATVDMRRTAADGDVNVRVRGAAVRRNHKTDNASLKEGFFDQNNVVTAKVAELLHGNYREPGLVTEEVVLTIGSTTMFIDGVEATANAAPYIDSANRTMLPVSAIGRALGATVEWNDTARTVLVTKDNTRALLTIGKDTMNLNGMEIPMRSKAVITGERTFVPLKDLGVALGAQVEWDAATRTVTVK